MAIKLRVADLSDVPAALRAHYRQQDGGGFILDAEPDPDGFGIDNLSKLRGQLEAAQRKVEKTAANLLKKQDGSLWTDADLAALHAERDDARAQLAAAAEAKAGGDEATAAAVAAARQPLEAEIATMRDRMGKYSERVTAAERDRIVRRAVEQLRPLPEFERFFSAELGRQIHVLEDADGSLHHTFLDDQGQPRPQGLEDLLPAWRAAYGRILQGDGREGAGPLNNGHNAAVRRQSRDIVLPATASQEQFESAFRQASERGGEVRFAEG